MAATVNLEKPENSPEYYALSVTAFGDSVCVETAGTKWMQESCADNEIREVTPYYDVDPWESFKERWIRVSDRTELLDFLTSGGHCLIAHDVVSNWWPEFFSPTRCFRYCQGLPFIGIDYLPPGADERYPPPLVRKRVLARDDYRCRVCGHSPEDHPAIKLEIHHVVEQAIGGLTIIDNLITLCKACHDNATPPDPWLRRDLFDKIVIATSRFHRRSHAQGVVDYRTWVARALRAKESDDKLSEPIESLTVFDDWDERKRYAKWDYAYALLATNSLVRYFTLNDWRRNLPMELKRR